MWDKSEFTIANKKVKLTVSVKNNLTLTFDPCEMCPELLTLLTLLSRYVDIKKVEQLMLEEFQNVKLNA